jgi:beta-xylosidase
MGDMAGVRNCWAPELAYDAQKGEFLIVWSSTVNGRFTETGGQSEDKYNHRMYFTTTKDFQSFAPAKLFLNPGYSVIDGTILKANDLYYLIFKDETRYPKPHKNLRIASSANITGPYGNIGAPISRDWVEGPTVLKIGDEYLLYFDAYTSKRYEALRSRDLRTWEDITAHISFPHGARHGTALAVPGEIIARLIEQNKG